MGHPKFSRKVWQGPKHPWQAERIEAERDLIYNYGLRNHREIWKATSKLRRWRSNAMRLIGTADSGIDHTSREKSDLLNSLVRKGLLNEGNTLDDILKLEVEHVLARRLQSQVYYKGLAASAKQARQLLIHGHIAIGDQVMTVPGYVLTREEEIQLRYNPASPVSADNHPLRMEIAAIRESADFQGDTSEAPEAAGPSAAEIAEIAEAVESAPSAADSEGGEA